MGDVILFYVASLLVAFQSGWFLRGILGWREINKALDDVDALHKKLED